MKLSIMKLTPPLAALSVALCAVCGAQAATTADYVQEGLIAQWDGVENAGRGVHDANAAVWRDVLSDAAFALKNVTIGDDCVTFAGNVNSYGELSDPDLERTIALGADGTIEIVEYTPTSGKTASVVLCCNKSVCDIVIGSTVYNKDAALQAVGSGAAAPLAPFDWGGATNTLSLLYAAGSFEGAFANGEELALSETPVSGWSHGASPTLIGKKHNNVYLFGGSLYAIRVYNRRLTADEIALNRAVDELRFAEGETAADLSKPQVRLAGITPNSGSATVVVELLSAGAGETAAVTLTYGTAEGVLGTVEVDAAMEPGSKTVTLTGLSSGVRYWFSVKAVDGENSVGACSGGTFLTPPLDGARFLGVPFSSTSFDFGLAPGLWFIFDLFKGTTPSATQIGGTKLVGFDAGTPRTVNGIVVSCADTLTGVNNTSNFKVYASNDPDDIGTEIAANTTALPRGMAEVTIPCDGAKGPYRYYRVGDKGATYMLNVAFYSTDLHLTQYRPKAWADDATPGLDDSADGIVFTGKMDYVPSGTAEVHVFIGRTDHGDDYAAWAADAQKLTVGGIRTDEKWSVAAGPLAAGRYVSRAFAVQGGVRSASQCTWPVTAGTSAYHPVCYLPETLAAQSTGRSPYDDSVESFGNTTVAPQFAVFDLDDPDKEVVAVRVWPMTTAQTTAWGSSILSYSAKWSFSSEAVDPAKVTGTLCESPRVIRTVAADPISDWTFVADGSRYLDMEIPTPRLIDVYLNETGVKYPKSLKLSDLDSWKTAEVELRTLPRPAEPDVADFSCDEVGGIFAKFSGHVAYRGNAQSDCTVLISCVPSGEDPVYVPYAEGLSSGADFAATVQGLAGETEYDWSIVVSNALAGVEAASGTFTTMQGGGLPTAEVVSVETNADGTVTVNFNVTSAGGTAVADVYAVYGMSPDALDTEVLLAEDRLGQGSAVLSGLVPGQLHYIAVRAKNAAGEVGEVSSAVTCTTVGPCGIVNVGMSSDGFTATVTGTLEPRGLGDAEIYLDYGEAEGRQTGSVLLGTVAAGAAADFSLAGTLPHLSSAWCVVRVVNTVGAHSWTARSVEIRLVQGFGLPCQPLGTDDKVFWAFAGIYNQNYYEVYASFDLGAPHAVGGLRVMRNSLGDSERGKDFTLWGSNDGKTYELVYTNRSVGLPQGGVYVDLPVETDATYRYFRMRGDASGRNLFSDIRILSADLAVEGRKPYFWEGSAALGDASDRGVLFAGRVLGTPNGSAHVYAMYAKSDLGDSPEVWKAKGRMTDLGVFAEGEAFSVRRTDIAAGAYACRYYAVSGADEYLSPCVYEFTAGTKPFAPPSVYLLASEVAAAPSLANAYDGDVTTMPSTVYYDKQVVFAAAEIPAGHRLASVRVWASSAGERERLMGASVDVAFEDADLETGSSVVQTKAGRTVKSVESLPEFAWTRAGAFNGRPELIEYVNDTRVATEIPISPALARRKPKFIRINRGTMSTQLYTVAEIEFRLVRERGLAIIVR